MKGCVKGPASFWRLHLKTKLILFLLVSTVSRLRMTHNQVEMQHADKSVESACCISICQCFTGLTLVHLHKGKVSAAVVTLGNILLPVLVARIKPLIFRCHGLHFPWTPAEKLSTMRFVMLPSYLAMSLFYWYYLLCFCLTHLSNSCTFLGWKKKKEERQWGRIFMNVNGGCGRSPWSVTNLCPVVLWPLRDVWMYVWLPVPVLFSQPVLYVFFLILGCTSGKRLPSTPQYVPQWHFTCVLVRVFVPERWLNICIDGKRLLRCDWSD